MLQQKFFSTLTCTVSLQEIEQKKGDRNLACRKIPDSYDEKNMLYYFHFLQESDFLYADPIKLTKKIGNLFANNSLLNTCAQGSAYQFYLNQLTQIPIKVYTLVVELHKINKSFYSNA